MCTCDPKRFEQAQAFITELTDRLIPISEEAGQKVRISVVQFNELAVTASHFSEFNGVAAETVDLFKKKVQDMTVDAFRGMGTNLTSGLIKIQEVFIEDGMTQDERDDMGLNTNIVSTLKPRRISDRPVVILSTLIRKLTHPVFQIIIT